MAHLALPWRSKSTSTTTSGAGDGHCRGSAGTTSGSNSITNCCGLSNLMRRLKKRTKTLHPASHQSSFQCRYDPLSYSLNFDTSGDFVDEDYYKFYAFSSRFVATSTTDECCRRVLVPAASH